MVSLREQSVLYFQPKWKNKNTKQYNIAHKLFFAFAILGFWVFVCPTKYVFADSDSRHHVAKQIAK